MKNVAIIGSILSERQFFVKELHGASPVVEASRFLSLTSSKVINAGRMMTCNHRVRMIGGVGRDSDGANALQALQEYGIDSTDVQIIEHASTGQVIVVVDTTGDYSVILYLGASEQYEMPDMLQGIDAIYAETSVPLPVLYRLINESHERNIPIMLDLPNKQKELDKANLRHVSVVAPNRQEAEALLSVSIHSVTDAIKAVKRLQSYTSGIALITLDKEGCVVVDDALMQPEHISAPIQNVKDTTAAGDIFRGVFFSMYIETGDVLESAKHATQIATASTALSGVDASIKDAMEVFRKQQER